MKLEHTRIEDIKNKNLPNVILASTVDRKALAHIQAAKERLENLWAAGTDYC